MPPRRLLQRAFIRTAIRLRPGGRHTFPRHCGLGCSDLGAFLRLEHVPGSLLVLDCPEAECVLRRRLAGEGRAGAGDEVVALDVVVESRPLAGDRPGFSHTPASPSLSTKTSLNASLALVWVRTKSAATQDAPRPSRSAAQPSRTPCRAITPSATTSAQCDQPPLAAIIISIQWS